MLGKLLSRKNLTVLVALAAALSLMVTCAFATGLGAEVTITGGTLTGGDVTFTNLSVVTLTGGVTTATATWPIANVVDPTGTGAGWNTTLTLTQFKQWSEGAYVTESPKILTTSSLSVATAPIVSKDDDTSSDVNTITPVGIGDKLDTTVPVKLLSAAAGGGMGSYEVTDLGVELTLPANVYACTYKTTATVSIVTGP